MGKRKERRLAAIAAAGRRVKLDLFAEPSGEMEGASKDVEVGDQNQDHQAGVPSSPSSTGRLEISGRYWCHLGQRHENPLMLLGQYSDDELDEEVPEQAEHDGEGNSSTNPNDKVVEHAGASEDKESIEDKDVIAGDVKQELDKFNAIKNLDDNNVRENNTTSEGDQYGVTDAQTQIYVPQATGIQTTEDVTGVWKMAMDEQSNRYYYWNTVTGETSWEVPGGLCLETQAMGAQNISSADEDRSNTGLMAYAAIATANQLEGGLLISKSVEEYGTAVGTEKGNGEDAPLAYDANQLLTNYSAAAVGVSYRESAGISDFFSSQQSNALSYEQYTTQMELHHLSNDEHKDQHMTKHSKCDETTDVHSAQLIKYGESLLQRLEALERSGKNIAGHEWIKKEIELRLSDCNVLSSYGSSLLPFWWHTETQLKQLESSIIREETPHLVQPEHHNELDLQTNSASGDEHSLSQDTGAKYELAKGKKSAVCIAENNGYPASDAVKEVETGGNSCVPHSEDTTGSEGTRDEAEMLEASQISVPSHLISRGGSHAEDVDMDVEMEVDDETAAVQTTGADLLISECMVSLEQINQPSSLSSECPVVPKDDFSIPPPPDEEWIPPPPPDNEPVPPPPPPEEPVATAFPHIETVHPQPYQEQYNLGYVVPSYNYYTPSVGEVAINNYYSHIEGCPVTEPQPTYYEPVNPSAFPEGVANVNPVEPTGYYEAPIVSIPTAPVVSSMEVSGYYLDAGAVSYNHITPLPDQGELASNSSSMSHLKLEPDVSAVTSVTKIGTMKVAPVATNASAAETVLVNGSVAEEASVAVPKNQTKVARSKKRSVAVAPSLRSNKKVSSLVDKWKAAKEELHGDKDEEPENAYEVLERKRQKEIEEWHARQIASEEAQDNANFVPLRGDWRERVRRKRAETKAEQTQSPSEAVENEKKQPDLSELSRDLPSGWQAYWDESTKEVYYGNTITSETTWTRPSR